MLDRFTKTALALMVVITVIFVIGAYLGYVAGSEMEGTDAMVEDTAASTANAEATSLAPAITDVVGEPIGFTIAGIVAGFIVGYFWTELFRRRENV
ncbi:MAG: hypothetical protein N2V78_10915 [Methanophagales archaeon]|nr:hypothetical protein [Methanophagales archaeon]MCW3141913.1 hypothetical protein [Methanophagales archaeon]